MLVTFGIVLNSTFNREVTSLINERDIYASFNYCKAVMLRNVNIVSSFMHCNITRYQKLCLSIFLGSCGNNSTHSSKAEI